MKIGKKRKLNHFRMGEALREKKDPLKHADTMLRSFVSGAYRNADTAHHDKRRKPRGAQKLQWQKEQGL